MVTMRTRCVSIKFFGRVQNVGFRYFVYKHAAEWGVKGFVKNLPDGSVYVEAEGDGDLIDLFINHCKAGPTHSYVSKVLLNEIPCQSFTDFTIR